MESHTYLVIRYIIIGCYIIHKFTKTQFMLRYKDWKLLANPSHFHFYSHGSPTVILNAHGG